MALVIPLSRKQKLVCNIDKNTLLEKIKKKYPGKLINYPDTTEPQFVPWSVLEEILNELDIEIISRFNTEVILVADRVINFKKEKRDYESSSGM